MKVIKYFDFSNAVILTEIMPHEFMTNNTKRSNNIALGSNRKAL